MWLVKRWRASEGQKEARKLEEKLVFYFVAGNVVSMEWWGKFLYEEFVGNVPFEVCMSHASICYWISNVNNLKFHTPKLGIVIY